jgi:hypothetical protein
VALLLDEYAGREAELMATLVARFGPEPPPPPPPPAAQPAPRSARSQLRPTMERVFAQHCPERLADVPFLAAHFAGRAVAAERLLFAEYPMAPASERPRNLREQFAAASPALMCRFGRMRQRGFIAAPQHGHGAAAAETPPPRRAEWGDRVARMYARYNPSRPAAAIDAVLLTWKGREDLLLSALIAKYGAEPREPVRYVGSDRGQIGAAMTPANVVRSFYAEASLGVSFEEVLAEVYDAEAVAARSNRWERRVL